MMYSKPKVFLGIPGNWPYYHGAFLDSLMLMDKKWMAYYARSKSASIAAMRNELVKVFLDTDADLFMSVDADGVIPRDAMNKLIELNLPVVSGIHASHDEPAFKSVMIKRERPFVGEFYNEPLYSVTRVYATGFPAIMIKREVFETLSFPWYEVKYLTADDGCDEQDIGRRTSSDLWFCEMCYRADIPVYVHPGVMVGHLTDGIVTIRGLEQTPVFERLTPVMEI